MKELLEAVRALADSVSSGYPSNHMTHFEADALARVLAIGGHEDKANVVLLNAALDDVLGEA